ncbi:VOC family protein [Micromonospora sp. DT68]|uniref:VOC family protein n=1 Tax=Micromonospora sp. DT68 TaxID=3416522 RepID=UPI003CF2147D
MQVGSHTGDRGQPASLDDAEARAIELGAVKEDQQFAPDRFRVLRDPAGHPFCLRRCPSAGIDAGRQHRGRSAR